MEQHIKELIALAKKVKRQCKIKDFESETHCRITPSIEFYHHGKEFVFITFFYIEYEEYKSPIDLQINFIKCLNQIEVTFDFNNLTTEDMSRLIKKIKTELKQK